MTLYPTHKTELKTALSKQEVLERLEHNNIYAIGFYYELKESGTAYTLNPVRKNSGRNIFAPIVNLKIAEKSPYAIINLSFLPLKATIIGVSIISFLMFIISVGCAAFDIVNMVFSIGTLLYIPIGLAFYIFCMLIFSFEVISVKKQIEEHINVQSNEITEDEMSKLQSWYEKEREPFNFRHK